MKLKDKTVLITGGGSGIGLEAVKQFLDTGAKVIITGRNQAKLDAAQHTYPSITAINSDVASQEDAQALLTQVKAMGGIDILYNNAGVVSKPLNLATPSEQHFDDAQNEININYLAVIRLNDLFMEMLKSRAESAIINTTSILSYQPINLAPTYSASKVALRFYTDSLRRHLKLVHSGVKVFELAPPAVATDMADGIDAKIMSPEVLVKALINGLKADNYTIRVGDAKSIYFLSRFIPQLAYKLVNTAKNNSTLPV
jgi:short-subunit dehydrogenase involved in D-alanine esterification of teichoic acids